MAVSRCRCFRRCSSAAEKETIEQTQIGAVQILRVSAGSLGPIVDDINVVNMPFLFKNMAQAERMMDGPIGQNCSAGSRPTPNAGLVALCWMNAGARSLYNTKHPVKSIEDIKGLKFRVIGNPIFIDMMNALGGNGVAMATTRCSAHCRPASSTAPRTIRPSYVFSNHYTAAKYFLAYRASYYSRSAGVLQKGLGFAFSPTIKV